MYERYGVVGPVVAQSQFSLGARVVVLLVWLWCDGSQWFLWSSLINLYSALTVFPVGDIHLFHVTHDDLALITLHAACVRYARALSLPHALMYGLGELWPAAFTTARALTLPLMFATPLLACIYLWRVPPRVRARRALLIPRCLCSAAAA